MEVAPNISYEEITHKDRKTDPTKNDVKSEIETELNTAYGDVALFQFGRPCENYIHDSQEIHVASVPATTDILPEKKSWYNHRWCLTATVIVLGLALGISLAALAYTVTRSLNQELQLEVALAEIASLNEACELLINPPANCREVEAANGTGTYTLRVDGNFVSVTCDFDVQLPPLSPVSGWQEIANIDLSDPSQFCPSPWRETLAGSSRRCELTSDNGGCESVFFPTSGVPFTKLCGRAVGYGTGSPDALRAGTGQGFDICSGIICGINDPYVDGVSITYGPSDNRQHIWSLTTQNILHSRCSCENNVIHSPGFVGKDYYCETFVESNSMLWDGVGCTDNQPDEAPCCANPNLPWFCREFDEPVTTDNIEVRICTDQPRFNEEVEIDLLKIFIQ